jgi:hypothetical protein
MILDGMGVVDKCLDASELLAKTALDEENTFSHSLNLVRRMVRQ